MSNANGVQLMGISNFGAEFHEAETEKDEGVARFRICKLSTDDDCNKQTVVNGRPQDHLPNFNEASQLSAKLTEEENKNEEKCLKTDQLKSVHLNLPSDYNDIVRSRSQTQTTQTSQTLGYMTHDAVPMSVFYRNALSIENAADGSKRPTLEFLHKGKGQQNATKRHWDALNEAEENGDEGVGKTSKAAMKLGWIKGVLLPTLLNIWGVILFLRMPMIVGNAGIGLSTVIVMLGTAVTTITALSLSAVCTNGEVKGGGAYYLISRSLGPQFGGSIGVIFSLANAIAVSLYLVGFAETIVALMEKDNVKMVGGINDIRIIGLIGLGFIFLITLVGLDWVIHTQSVLLLLLVTAIIAVVVGTVLPSPEKSREEVKKFGLTGYSGKNFKDNFGPDFRDGKGFFDIFAVFFPASTGIMAGANLSGDLKDPSKAVPLGTLLAIGITTFSYILLCWLLGASTAREGLPQGYWNSINQTTVLNNFTTNISTTMVYITSNITCDASVPTTDTTTCKYGSTRDMQIMEKISIWGPLVLIGIFAATLSSALASLVSAPKVFQAVCVDKIFPHIEIFGKGYGKSGEPRNGYILTMAIAAAFIAIGKLDIIAPIISNFFLMAYALVNYSVFQSSLSKSPGWRPSFKFYNMWVSLLGFLLCIAIMFLINWWAALITIVVVAGLYKYVDIRKPDINWGSSGQAHTYMKALRFTRRLDDVEDHVKNYRVQVLCLSGKPSLRPNLLDFASHITKHYGLLVCGDVAITDRLSPKSGDEVSKWLKKRKIKAFHQIVQDKSFRSGVRSLLQSTGLGKLKPNTLLIGYKNRWQKAPVAEVEEYFHTIHDAFDLRYGVGVLRLQDGFDITDDTENDNIENGVVDNREPDWYTEDWDEQQGENAAPESEASDKASTGEPSVQTLDIVQQFHKKRVGYIDVWWLYDDGGLTMLVPHLLSLSSHWRGCKLRIFTPASDKKIKANQIRMANLLKKFRIDFSSVVEFRGINKNPKADSVNDFKKYRNGEHLTESNLDKKTLRQIRLGELLHEHSQEAVLIVLTLPIPKKSVVSSLMYMSWLEVLSAHLPPVLLIRGNQDSVLTYYS